MSNYTTLPERFVIVRGTTQLTGIDPSPYAKLLVSMCYWEKKIRIGIEIKNQIRAAENTGNTNFGDLTLL